MSTITTDPTRAEIQIGAVFAATKAVKEWNARHKRVWPPKNPPPWYGLFLEYIDEAVERRLPCPT